MICFEVSLNGKKLWTAGVKSGVVTAGVDYRTEPSEKQFYPSVDSVLLHINGMSDEHHIHELLSWGGIKELSVGDELSIKIVSAERCDEPSLREPRGRRRPIDN